MLIRSKDYVPYFYRNSRDYQAILSLFDLIVNVTKINIDTLIDNLDPYKCNYALLKLLASYVGYHYDTNISYDANRLIISNYITMIRNRGSKDGLKIAAALAFNAKEDLNRKDSTQMFSIDYIESENKIVIYVYVPTYIDKIRDLLERVRPAGVKIAIIPAFSISSNETIEVHDYFNPEKKPYDDTRRNVSDESKVGFTEVTRSGEPHKL